MARLKKVLTMSREKILILDKEPNIRWTLQSLLETEKYRVIAFGSIERFLKGVSRLVEVSGLITEYMIDQSCTLETIRTFKRNHPEAYVMMLASTDIGEEKYGEVLKAGVDDYFLKPFSSQKILLHLQKGLELRRLLLDKKRLEERFDRNHVERSSSKIYAKKNPRVQESEL
jgi:DNA-binding NtrC family response regulator